ncbi:MAG: ATP-binding protein [Planctomycetota bacterium]|nr:ATP-binding protein [Planctomycetota bacterium]
MSVSRSLPSQTPDLRANPLSAGNGMGMDQLQDLMLSFNETAERLHETHEALHCQVQTLESELAEANEQLRRSQQLAALGEMAAGIAHEIRNPLGSIQLYAQVLVEDLEDRPDSVDLCNKIGTAVRGMESIVRDVLQFARDTSLQQEHVLIGSIIDRVVCDSEGLLATAATSLRRDTSADSIVVSADLTLMVQAIGNILRNAVESMDDSEREDRVVTIESSVVRRLKTDGDRHEIVSISISDRGCGVPEDLVHRLFNPFFTTRPTGTGLGLAIAHRVVDAHGGDIVVGSREGGGSVFEVHVPLEAVGKAPMEICEPEVR